MDDPADTDVLVRDGDRAWAVGRPSDLHGDAYVHTLPVMLSIGHLELRSWVTFEGDSPETLRDFLGGLASQWRGWEGEAWSLRVPFHLEAGEQLRQLAEAADAVLSL